ncbi:hypothetical protein ACFLXE_05280, partial [Chloroflexota bacterium]
ESRDVCRQSNMDSCFRRNDNLLNTGPFWVYGIALEKALGRWQQRSVYFCNEALGCRRQGRRQIDSLMN